MRTPTATYRLQFTPEFGFGQGRAVLPYLQALGITEIYASPTFHARTGSTHGYDVVDANRLNPELGSNEEFEALVADASFGRRSIRKLRLAFSACVREIPSNRCETFNLNSVS